MRTIEEVRVDIEKNDEQQNQLGIERGNLEKEVHEIQQVLLIASGVLSRVSWKPITSGTAKVYLEKLGKNYEPKELFSIFAWEHGDFELDDHTELLCSDGELFFRFERTEDFQHWNDILHLKISSKEVDNEIKDLQEKLQELQKIKAKIP